jgi:hypothetical protein
MGKLMRLGLNFFSSSWVDLILNLTKGELSVFNNRMVYFLSVVGAIFLEVEVVSSIKRNFLMARGVGIGNMKDSFCLFHLCSSHESHLPNLSDTTGIFTSFC